MKITYYRKDNCFGMREPREIVFINHKPTMLAIFWLACKNYVCSSKIEEGDNE